MDATATLIDAAVFVRKAVELLSNLGGSSRPSILPASVPSSQMLMPGGRQADLIPLPACKVPF
jgi:hypothetical protein